MADKSKNNTMPYGAQTQTAEPTQADKDGLRAAAEKSVREQHGNIEGNPNYEALVQDAMDQISNSAEQNKNM